MLALLAALTLGGLSSAPAAPRTWDGGDGSGDWTTSNSDKKNWDADKVYVIGEDVIFAGSVQTSVTIGNNAGLTSGSITFASGASAFAIGGTGTSTLTIGGAAYGSGITNASGNQQSFTVTTIALGSAQTWDAGSVSGGSLSISSSVNNGGNLLTIAGVNNTTLSGVIGGLGGLTQIGTGTLTLSGTSANAYSGLTTVNAGTLTLNKTAGVSAIAGNLTIGDGTGTDTVQLSAADQIADTAAVTINSSGVLNLNGNSETIGSLTMTAGSVTTGAGAMTLGGDVTGNAASASATISGNLNLGGGIRTFTIADGAANEDMSASAAISNGALTKAGDGTLGLSGNNTYSGQTTVNAGVVRAGNNAAFGTTAGGVSVAGGAAVELTGGIAVGAEALALNGTGVSGGGALRNLSGDNSWAGALTLGSDSRINSDSGTLTVSGGISGGAGYNLSVGGDGNVAFTTAGLGGGGWLAKDGAGTLNLNVASTYTGGTMLNGGAISLGADDALGSGGLNFAGGILNANNHSDSSIGALTLSANSTLNLSSGGNAGSLTFDSASYSSGTLTINNWSGTGRSAGTDDRIYITAQPDTTFLANVQFTGFNSGAIWFTDTKELVPVPEPIHYALGVFGLLFGGLRAGRCFLARRRQANR